MMTIHEIKCYLKMRLQELNVCAKYGEPTYRMEAINARIAEIEVLLSMLGDYFCDLCHDGKTVAAYDARTRNGQWAYLCQKHFEKEGCSLGTGHGQKLVKVEVKVIEDNNQTKIELKNWLKQEGYDDVVDAMEAFGMDSVVPALCTEGCEVEPDGKCEHGNPAVTMALGMF